MRIAMGLTVGNTIKLAFTVRHIGRYAFEAEHEKWPGIVGCGRSRKAACLDVCEQVVRRSCVAEDGAR